MFRNCCEVTDRAFDKRAAERDLRRYGRSGPAVQTRELLKVVRGLGLAGVSLLDVGGGVGAIHHELLEDVAREAIHVDAATAYLEAAREEAARRGHSRRVRFVHADFAEVAAELPQADVVTLDRVVCCYPDYRRLLQAAAGRCQKALGMTYPRETWYLRICLGILNAIQRLRGDPFRAFLHPVRRMEDLLNGEGMHLVSLKRLPIWEVALYARRAMP